MEFGALGFNVSEEQGMLQPMHVDFALQNLRLQDVGEGSKSARQAVAEARAAAEEGS